MTIDKNDSKTMFQLLSILGFLFLASASASALAVQGDHTPRSLELSSECQSESTDLLIAGSERLITVFKNATYVIDNPDTYDGICTLETVNSTVTADCDYAKLLASSVSVDPTYDDYSTECETIGGKIIEMDSTLSSCSFSYTVQDIPICVGMSCDPDEFVEHLQEQSNSLQDAFEFVSDLFGGLFGSCVPSYELSYTGVIEDFIPDDDSAGMVRYGAGYGQWISLFVGIATTTFFMLG